MRGVYTALITPFNSKNEVDLPAFKKILEDQKAAGVAGVVPCGTTGETPTLSVEEKKALITTSLEVMRGSGVRVIAGTGSNDTAGTIEFSRWASQQKVDGILVVTPFYNKPSQAGMDAHFRAVADAVTCEVVLYNVPGRTGVSLSATTVAALSKHPRITTIKEATANIALTSEILDLCKIDVLSGDDATYLPLLSVGAVGVISVASNLFPRAMVAIQKAYESGKVEEARTLHQKFYPLFRDLFIDSNPVPVKRAMEIAGFCEARVRAPLAGLSPAHNEVLQISLNRCGISHGSRS